MKLIGSRSTENFRPNSDWDIYINIPITVSSEEYPNWEKAIPKDLDSIRNIARKKFNIPCSDHIDLFFSAYCPNRKWPYAIVFETGYTVVIAETLESAELQAEYGIE